MNPSGREQRELLTCPKIVKIGKPYLTPLKVRTGWISSGNFSLSGHKKLSMIGIILHCESRAATISCKETKLRIFDVNFNLTPFTYPMNPVFAIVILYTAVQRVGRQDQEEMPGLTNALKQVIVKLPSLQSLHVDEHGKASQLKMDFEQARELRPV